MLNYEDIKKAQDYIVEQWGENGEKVITACYYSRKGVMSNKEFLDNCTACGGDWGAMLLTGIKRLFPQVWDAIPNEMGMYAFIILLNVLILCGVDTSENN